MKRSFKTILLVSLISVAASAAEPLSTTTKLEGVCLQPGGGQVAQFVLLQDILGGRETKPIMVPSAAARVTIEYETSGNAGIFYHARFSLFSFDGDLAVLESHKDFAWLDHEQPLVVTLQTKKGAKLKCVANVLNVK